jgi:hypothetical protein
LGGLFGFKEAAERLADWIELLPSRDLLLFPPSFLGIEVGYLSLLNYYCFRLSYELTKLLGLLAGF